MSDTYTDGTLQTRDECRCGREARPYTNWCSAECYQNALKDAETAVELPCLNDHWWCPGPGGPTEDGVAWGGMCSDCYIEMDTEQ